MPDLVPYRGLNVVDNPSGVGGVALTDNFKTIADWHPKSVWDKTTDPTEDDGEADDFWPGSFWLNLTSVPVRLWVCIATSETSATWLLLSSSTLKRLSSAATVTSSTTLTDISALTLAIGANETWDYSLDLCLSGTFDQSGFKIACTVPSGASLDLDVTVMGSDQTAANIPTIGDRTSTSGTALSFTASWFMANTAVGPLAEVRVLVKISVANGSNAGNIQPRWAQQTSSASTLTLRRGSRGVASKV